MSYSSIYIKDNVRIYVSDLTEVAQKAIEAHQTDPLISLVLATGVAAFGAFSIMKARGRTSVTLKTNGVIKNLIVEANADGEIRALVGNPNIATEYDNKPEEDINSIPLQLAVGDAGSLKIVQEYNGENFGGEVPLAKGDIVTDLAYYFDQSEQVKTAILTSISLKNDRKTLDRAFSVIFQMLPEHTEEDIVWVEEFIKENKLTKLGLNEFVERMDAKYFATKELKWKCKCSKEKMQEVISLLDKKEIEEIKQEQGKLEITCNFCNKKYLMD